MTETEQWIRELIQKDELHKFYVSTAWEKLASRARTLQHNECQRCRQRGLYVPCDVVHHRQYVRNRPDLALDVNNLECLCHECHNIEHGKTIIPLTEERW